MGDIPRLTLRLPFRTFFVHCSSPAAHAALSRWSTLLQGPAPEGTPRTDFYVHDLPEGGYQLSIGNTMAQIFKTVDDLLAAMEKRFYQPMSAPPENWVVAHASVLARANKAYLFCGPSGAGKSVLALDWARRGWTYLSDEFAPIGPDGTVMAVPRPVTFVSRELPASVRSRLIEGTAHWTSSTTSGASAVHCLHVLPAQRSLERFTFPLGGVFQLIPRKEARPRMERLNASGVRAFLFALRNSSKRVAS
jgi:hypothetical protein